MPVPPIPAGVANLQRGWRHVTDHKSAEWQALYQKALLERDPAELPADIARAEGAIHSRLKRLAKNGKGEAERHAISEALSALCPVGGLRLPYSQGF